MNKKLTIVYNSYVNEMKKNNQIGLLMSAAKILKIKLFLIPSESIKSLINQKKLNLPSKKILFLEKNIALAQLLESNRYKLYNNSNSIYISDNKALTHVALSKLKIKQPKTLIGPLTFNLKNAKRNLNFQKIIKTNFKFPLIVKEVFGSFGQQVFLVKNLNDLNKLLNDLGGKQIIIQEFLNFYLGKSIRVLVVNKKIVGVMQQENKNDFRSNLSQNGIGTIIPKLKSKEKEVINRIITKLNLFYSGIDFLLDEKRDFIFCEANSNPQLTNISNIFQKNFGIDLLKEIMVDCKYG